MRPPPSPGEAPVHDPLPVLPAYYSSADGKQGFVGRLFDSSAGDYDRLDRFLAFGTGSRYRREALIRGGLAPGMRVLDVAVGTGLVSKEAIRIVGERGSVTGIDPSAGMIARAAGSGVALVRGRAESLPFDAAAFDFLVLGFALRHVTDLGAVLREFHRVLAPGGLLLLLEITQPEGKMAATLVRMYLRGIVPFVARLIGRSPDAPKLYRYYWDTIAACVPPERVLASLAAANFTGAHHRLGLGIFSEYRAIAAGP